MVSEKTPGGEPAPKVDLVGSRWLLDSLHGERLVEDTKTTLAFEESPWVGPRPATVTRADATAVDTVP